MSDKKIKNIFVQGPVNASFVGESIASHSTKTNIGAHQIFLGQVRRDEIGGKFVEAIEYTAFEERLTKWMQYAKILLQNIH